MYNYQKRDDHNIFINYHIKALSSISNMDFCISETLCDKKKCQIFEFQENPDCIKHGRGDKILLTSLGDHDQAVGEQRRKGPNRRKDKEDTKYGRIKGHQ